jgi:diacylglycerol kinase family enzyme
VRENNKIIVAAGGDGTANGVASKLVNTEACLGILPMGTFNHLARDLGIPAGLNEAIALVGSGEQKSIDVGRVNDKIFLNNSSLGLYPKLVRYREERQRNGWRKSLALLQAIVSLTRRYSFLNMEMEIHGSRQLYKTPFVFIGNNEYEIERFNIGHRARLNAGSLSVYVARWGGRLGLIKLAWHALVWGGLRQHKDFEEYKATKIEISTRKKFLRVALDGEVVTLSMPLRYKIIPQALRVIAPKV